MVASKSTLREWPLGLNLGTLIGERKKREMCMTDCKVRERIEKGIVGRSINKKREREGKSN